MNEISKFYELAVMQLEGCLSIVHAETESSFLESSHEEVLNDLRDIKDRLQWRLKESELAIVEKDKELAQRLENELQLRHSLELKERQLVSLGVEELGERIMEDFDVGELNELVGYLGRLEESREKLLLFVVNRRKNNRFLRGSFGCLAKL